MAIPFSPPHTDMEDQYLHMMLQELFILLQQIREERRLRQPSVSFSPTGTRTRTTSPPGQDSPVSTSPLPAGDVAPHPRLPAPEVIPDQLDFNRKVSPPPTPSTAEVTLWAESGAHLRHIADTFRATTHIQQRTPAKPKRSKGSHLVSLLCPALAQSIWATLAFFLGWNLMSPSKR